MLNISGKGLDYTKAPDGGWGLNEHIFKKRYDVLFDMHNIPEDIKNGVRHEHRVQRMYDTCRKKNIKLYSLESWPQSPCIRYPIEEIKRYFGIDYFASSFDYMIALAIYQGHREISLWGVHLRAGKEYAHQLPSVCFWIGIAYAKKIKIRICTKSTIFKLDHLYGYNTKPELINNFIAA